MDDDLVRSVQGLAVVLQSIGDAVLATDPRRRIVWMNAVAERMTGWTQAEARGRPVDEVFVVLDDTTREPVVVPVEEVLSSGGARSLADHSLLVARDGREWSVTDSIAPIRGDDGRILGVVLVFRDVTRERRAEQRYREIVERSPDVIFLNRGGRVHYMNPAGLRLLRATSEEEVIGRSIYDLFHPDFHDRIRERVDKLRQTPGANPILREKMIALDGTELDVEVLRVSFHSEGHLDIQVVARDVTERQRAEEALRKQSTMLLNAEHMASMGAWSMDLATNRLEWSDGTCRLFGIRPEEFDGSFESYSAMILPEDRVALAEALRRAEGTTGLIEVEYRIRRPDGEVRWMYDRGNVEHDPSGRPIRRVGMVMDVTERKAADEALRASEERFRRMFMGAATGIAVTTIDGRFLEANAAYCRMLGYSESELRDMDFLSLTHPADRARNDEVIRELLEGKHESLLVEKRYMAKDGRIVWCRLSISTLKDVDGRPVSIIGVTEDITEQREAEKRERELAGRLTTTLESITDAFFTLNQSWQFTYVNAEAERLLQRPRADLLGRNVWDEFPEAVGTVFDHDYRRAIEQSQAVSFVEFYPPLESWLEVRAYPSSEGLAVYFRDVTHRRELEAQLLQSQKMEAVGQLAGGVAHDFNNLLTIIWGYSEAMISMVPASDPMRSMLIEIRDAGERAANLTRQLLAFSRKQMLAPRVLDLNDVVGNVGKMLQRLIGEDIRITSVLEPDLDRIKVDPGQLEQVIINLAVNARDAMPKGGLLTIETHNVEIGEQESERRLDCAPGPYVELTISDTGTGMSPEVEAHIFEPFYTTKEPGKGTGLGLATVFGIVKQSDGLIDVYSEVGVGTRFRILFPAIVDPSASTARRHTPVRGGSETVLLVEDDDGVRRIARLGLESHGYRVLEATNGREALGAIERHTSPIHVVVTDVVMPEMSGRELVEHLRRRHAGMKVLFMSGYTDDAVVRHGVVEATDAFLQKPFTPITLAKKVREVLDG